MSTPESDQSPENNVDLIVIDIEEYFEAEKPHPDRHHHKLVHYRVKIDDEHFTLQTHHVKDDDLLALVDKSPDRYQLFQVIREDGNIRDKEIPAHETIDLSSHHRKYFFTREKKFCFFIGKKEYKTHHEKLTVRQILVDFAKVSPDNKTLAEKRSGGYHEFKSLDEEIELKGCPHFTLFDNNPTALS